MGRRPAALVLLTVLAGSAVTRAQNPRLAAPPGAPRLAPQVMAVTTTAWPDGTTIPDCYTQAGSELSPGFAWTDVPDGTVSFVLIARDIDATTGDGTDQIFHWLLWNIPGSARGLPEGLPHGSQLAGL